MNIFSKIFSWGSQPTQQKSSSMSMLSELMSYPLFGSYAEFDIDVQELLPYKALLLYRIIAPVNTGINLIAEEFSNLKPRIYDEKAKKFVDHDVLKLLNHPFGDMSWREFATELATYFLITGNNYTVATGNIKRPPLELVNLLPASVSIWPSPKDGYNDKYFVTLPMGSTNYVRDEKIVPGYFRFVSAYPDGDVINKELWHIRTFNPRNRPGIAFYGMSPLTGIFYEIEQYLFSSKHNRGLLRNGAKLSTVFMIKNLLKPETFARLKEQLREFTGAENAGKSMILEDGMDAKELGLSNKDMDFLQLKKEVAMAIYNNMRIPIPLVVSERTTLNNMQEARLQLYDNAVFPLADRIFEELTIFLMPRYKGSENLIITYDEQEISALEPRRLDQVTKKQQLGIFTINELRAMMCYPEVEGGDEIYHTSSEVPISEKDEDPSEDNALANQDNNEEVALQEEEANSEKKLISRINSLRFSTGESVFKSNYNY